MSILNCLPDDLVSVMRKPALTPRQMELGLRSYANGDSMMQIAHSLGVSERTIGRMLHRAGVEIRHQGRGTLEICSRGHRLGDYGRYKSDRDKYGPCKECNRIAAQESKARCVKALQKIKLQSGCTKCGYRKSAWALDFHHRDPSTKLFSIGSTNSSRKWETLLKEIAKCDVLCRNCHSELHESEHHDVR